MLPRWRHRQHPRHPRRHCPRNWSRLPRPLRAPLSSIEALNCVEKSSRVTFLEEEHSRSGWPRIRRALLHQSCPDNSDAPRLSPTRNRGPAGTRVGERWASVQSLTALLVVSMTGAHRLVRVRWQNDGTCLVLVASESARCATRERGKLGRVRPVGCGVQTTRTSAIPSAPLGPGSSSFSTRRARGGSAARTRPSTIVVLS